MKSDATLDRWEFERVLWDQGLAHVAGVDEAGRGPLAGPVVAAAVVLPMMWGSTGLPDSLQGLNDSKQVSEPRRNRFFKFLMECDHVLKGIGVVTVKTIDEVNILNATHQAMNEALAQLDTLPEHVLVDGLPVPTIRFPQTALVKGDSRSYSIAAASILAKVTRDQMMLDYSVQWPEYGFAIHKGYPTAQHLASLQKWGPCEIHRRSFGPVRDRIRELQR